MALIPILLPSSSPITYLKIQPKPKTTLFPQRLRLKPSVKSYDSYNSFLPFNSFHCKDKSQPHLFFQTFQSLDSIKPYIQSEWKPILKGWACSVISVYSLSKLVPKVGKFSAVLSSIETIQLRDEGLVLGGLMLARFVANYWQQAFLWDAASNSVYKIRVYVFERVLQRDLGYFEGGDGISAGDIAYRITAEASDVADTVYALLNTIVPSILQLSAMATQMFVISPVLSLISALVIPCMALVIAYLGERLRKVSKKANLSIARLSAYLNEGTFRIQQFIPVNLLDWLSLHPRTVGDKCFTGIGKKLWYLASIFLLWAIWIERKNHIEDKQAGWSDV